MVVGPRLERIFKTFDQDGELIKAWDGIVETLSAHEVLMWKAPHKPNFICVEESNRGGAGVNVPRAEDPEPPQKYFDRFHEFISCAFCLSSFLSLSAIEKILLKKKTHTSKALAPGLSRAFSGLLFAASSSGLSVSDPWSPPENEPEQILMNGWPIHSRHPEVHDAFANGARHCQGGWSLTKADVDNWAIQMVPGTKYYKDTLEFNKVHVWDIGGLNHVDTLFGASFSGSHGNTFLRGIISGARCDDEKIAPNGFLDETFLRGRHPGIGRALDNGLTWNIIKHEVFMMYPKVVSIGQAALNHKSTLEISEMEGLLTMHRYAKHQIAAGKKEAQSWEAARILGTKQQPFWGTWSPALVSFASKFGTEALEEARDVRNLLVKALRVGDCQSHLFGHSKSAMSAMLKLSTPTPTLQTGNAQWWLWQSNPSVGAFLGTAFVGQHRWRLLLQAGRAEVEHREASEPRAHGGSAEPDDVRAPPHGQRQVRSDQGVGPQEADCCQQRSGGPEGRRDDDGGEGHRQGGRDAQGGRRQAVGGQHEGPGTDRQERHSHRQLLARCTEAISGHAQPKK